MSRLFLVLTALAVLFGCASKVKVADGVKPMLVGRELAETELLDVAIAVFDSEELTEKDTEKFGLSEEIRRAEERFVPIHLKYTLQRSGYWGAVRVVPAETAAHVQLRGTIDRSDGEELTLTIEAIDARGVRWFSKTYTEQLEPPDFKDPVPEKKDPFQDLYNTIANDLAEHRQKLTADDLREIQQVSELRFARNMAPDTFDGYLLQDEEGRYGLNRLPVEDDPMLGRVRAVKVRDAMLLDTINGYYDIYYQDLWQPYGDWRRLHAEEVAALKKVERQALTRQLLGAAAVIGGILVSAGDSNAANSSLPTVMIAGGAAAIYSGFQKREETKIHKEVLEELSISFSSEAEPLVVEVIGETVRLTGSAEEQYRKWREMLRKIYTSETGLPPYQDGAEKGERTDFPAQEMAPGQ